MVKVAARVSGRRLAADLVTAIGLGAATAYGCAWLVTVINPAIVLALACAAFTAMLFFLLARLDDGRSTLHVTAAAMMLALALSQTLINTHLGEPLGPAHAFFAGYCACVCWLVARRRRVGRAPAGTSHEK
ncbi:hypothetical protein GCM10022221_75190 [Actinocorallia aurea]